MTMLPSIPSLTRGRRNELHWDAEQSNCVTPRIDRM
jgi:hypothetical protein